MGKKSLLKNFYTTPFGDRSILELAELSIQEYELGKDDIPDILFLGLSATDGVGHDNGPHSFEQLDNHLRLDKYLGDFINSQEDKLGKGNILYILSSDHGVLDLPEYLSEQGIDSGRISRAVRDSIFNITMKKIRSQVGKGKIYRYENFFYFDHSMNGAERKVATEILKEQLINIPGVDSVVTKYELLKDGKDNISRRLKNMVHINKSPDIYLILKKYWTWTSKRGTSHGSPYDYDTHIPLIFSGGNKISKIRSDYIRSVDIAPTLARILEINYPKDIDGKPFLIK
jgi:predicted AlkP superfamily pyrophosphatase or phosphodiesterase